MSGDNIPIDIHYNKLPDWIQSRRHCKPQWQASVLTIREKINSAIQDMPAVDEITQLLQGTYINYFHCLRIVELLKDTESATKNIFGRYSSQRMKDWQEIVQLYETDGVYLAEAAQLLTRNVNYEIASLKRQIAKCQQSQQDCTRKQGEYASNSNELKDKFHTSCKQMGIEGKKVKSELVALVKDMPATYERIAASSKSLTPAAQFYSDFMEFTLKSKDLGSGCVPMLKHIQEHGNSTTYEWRTGEAPQVVEEPKVDFSFEDEEDAKEDVEAETRTGNIHNIHSKWPQTGNSLEEHLQEWMIDWGADTIDFGDPIENVSAGEIDFGDDSGGGDIDWGSAGQVEIEVVGDQGGITMEESREEGVARGTDALTLLDNTKTRNAFSDDLMELEAFLTQRLLEMGDKANITTSNQFHSAPATLQATKEAVEAMLSEVAQVLQHMTSSRMQDLFLIRSSPRYVDRLSESLKKILDDSEKSMSLSRLMVLRREEALEEQRQAEPKLDLLRKRTSELKKQIEKDISAKYQNRRVNIMGEINTI